jgi:hypothetical protein
MRNCRLQSLLAFRFVVTPTDLAPVFDAMLDKALRLGAATFGTLLIRDGELFKGAATRNPPPQLQEFVQEPFKNRAPAALCTSRSGRRRGAHFGFALRIRARQTMTAIEPRGSQAEQIGNASFLPFCDSPPISAERLKSTHLRRS